MSDREDLALMERWMKAHERAGTTPAPESVARYHELRARGAT